MRKLLTIACMLTACFMAVGQTTADEATQPVKAPTIKAAQGFPVSSVKAIVGTMAQLLPTTLLDPTAGTWESSNTDVATVDANGRITAIAPGQTTITFAGYLSYTLYVYALGDVNCDNKVNVEDINKVISRILN